jgi:hypothetical protein
VPTPRRDLGQEQSDETFAHPSVTEILTLRIAPKRATLKFKIGHWGLKQVTTLLSIGTEQENIS